MTFAFYASQASYARHVLPIVAELRERGRAVRVWSHGPGQPWGPPLVHLSDLGETVVVASAIDAQRVQQPGRTVVYVEHGAGQTYLPEPDGDRRAGFGYPGGPGLGHVHLFLTPSERVADRWRRVYPLARVVVVGCPALDEHFVPSNEEAKRSLPQVRAGVGQASQSGRKIPTVAVSCHWRCGASPEAFPALPHFLPAIPALHDHLTERGIELVGHAHPRIARRLAETWSDMGVRYEPDPDVILSTSSLLIVDNSSIAYEAAAVGLPTLNLNSPQWRRDVHHGLRFWSHVPGLQCDRPQDLEFMVDLALDDPIEVQRLRRHAALFVYSHVDGHASARSADAILKLDPKENA